MGRNHTDTLRAGDPAPAFTLDSSLGRPVSLADYRDAAGVMLVFVRGTI